MNTKRLTLFLSLALWLGACGTIISVENLEIRIPTRAAIPTISASPSIVPSLTSVPTVTATASPTAILSLSAVTTANVNFRIAPSTDNTPILVVLTGTRVTLVGRNSDASWLRTILADGRQGWMFWQNLSISGNRFDLPVITVQATATPTIDPTPTQERLKRGIGYNINGESVPNEAYLLQVVSNPCVPVQLVMNNLALAVRIKQLCPDTLVVSRNYSALEGDEWALRTPQSMIEQWRREGHPEIIRHSTNEPSFGRGLRLQQFVQAEVLLMRLAREAGFTLAMGNFSVGIYEAADIDAGLFDPYIRGLNQYGHYLGLHEYSLGVLAFGTGQWPPQCLLDRLCVQPERWPTEQLLVRRVWSDGIWQQPPHWYLGRGIWWLNRADLIAVPRPRIILTEFGWDNLPNIKPIIEPLRWQYGLPQYFNDMRGINTYPRLWAWYWPNQTFAESACRQLIWADKIYPSDYLGFALFTWSGASDWRQTDMSGRENPTLFELHQCLAAA